MSVEALAVTATGMGDILCGFCSQHRPAAKHLTFVSPSLPETETRSSRMVPFAEDSLELVSSLLLLPWARPSVLGSTCQQTPKRVLPSPYQNVLWFGFGVKHIVRLLAESDQGSACLGLCGCLSVSYDDFFSAQVLRNLAVSMKSPEFLTPSVSQWSSLVKITSGTLALSDFPNIVFGFSRLWAPPGDGIIGLLRVPGSPFILGGALSLLADVSCGKVASITFRGGVECAWLAAVAEWLLSLRVEVINAQDGSLLYRKFSCSGLERVQITILRGDGEDNCQCLFFGKSYYVPSGRRLHCFKGYSIMSLAFSLGTSTWTTILSDTFGNTLSKFSNSEGADLLFCLLRRIGESTKLLLNGLDILAFVLSKLPELKGSPHLNLPRDYTRETLLKAFDRAIEACGCKMCQRANVSRSVAGELQPSFQRFCLVHLALTIREYVEVLLQVRLDEHVQPSPLGLASLYQSIGDKMETSLNHNYRMFKEIPIQYHSTLCVLNILVMPSESVDENQDSAVCCHGITAYVGSLLENRPTPIQARLIHILPGHIEREGSYFDRIDDMKWKGQSVQCGTRIRHLPR
ncbi:hypothetical protein AJ80_03008 [Polytolypa hystricis UAMH7299]|uniref:Uncharacterized protein n=1 Tax=Polytolypa hystricis (strain UAMH7299) TaxID=1447883 RepID=A0A2B7YPI6_POLH7|nr:hypothetical protein AJ80_03008 [Polytolypa hystricis UAMH7299]